jgi:hypothetical protein
MKKLIVIFLFVTAGCLFTTTASAADELSGRLPIIAHGELKEQIKSMPIEQRPDRPLHFYGNTIRRWYRRSGAAHDAAPAQAAPTATAPSAQ